jgi:hypothetical protein
MRQITADAIDAFSLGKNFKRGNTEVTARKDKVRGLLGGTVVRRELILHGSVIAESYRGRLYLNTHGHNTATTKERLNGFHSVNIIQKNFVWFLNGKAWDGGRVRMDYRGEGEFEAIPVRKL